MLNWPLVPRENEVTSAASRQHIVRLGHFHSYTFTLSVRVTRGQTGPFNMIDTLVICFEALLHNSVNLRARNGSTKLE